MSIGLCVISGDATSDLRAASVSLYRFLMASSRFKICVERPGVGAGIGVGNVWSSYITAIARNPASKEEIGANIWIGFAVTEAIALFALIVALIALFA